MQSLRLGDRGPRVQALQSSLNEFPSQLPRLKADGIFGPKTQARVVEFQRSNALVADGVAGPATFGKLALKVLQPVDPLEALQMSREQWRVIAGLLQMLDLSTRPNYMMLAQSTVRGQSWTDQVLDEVIPVPPAVILIILIMLFICLMLMQSQNPATKELGRQWERKVRQLHQDIRHEPIAKQIELTLGTAKELGRAVVKHVSAGRTACLSNLDPTILQKCERQIKALSQALQDLSEKINKVLGGGITEESLVKGIQESITRVSEKAKEFKDCTGCDPA